MGGCCKSSHAAEDEDDRDEDGNLMEQQDNSQASDPFLKEEPPRRKSRSGGSHHEPEDHDGAKHTEDGHHRSSKDQLKTQSGKKLSPAGNQVGPEPEVQGWSSGEVERRGSKNLHLKESSHSKKSGKKKHKKKGEAEHEDGEVHRSRSMPDLVKQHKGEEKHQGSEKSKMQGASAVASRANSGTHMDDSTASKRRSGKRGHSVSRKSMSNGAESDKKAKRARSK